MEQPWKKVSESEKETIDIGSKIIKELPEEVNLIILSGELGIGKTVLVKGMAKALGIKDEITSPTFGYKNTYKGMSHYDLFLLKKMKSKELLSLISEEMEDNIVIIEWGEKIPSIKNSAIITFRRISDTSRIIEVKLK